jgi:hypothetical protein
MKNYAFYALKELTVQINALFGLIQDSFAMNAMAPIILGFMGAGLIIKS